MFASFNRSEIQMTLAEAKSACHPGKCDEDVAALLKTPKIKRQLAKIPDADLIAELDEYGAWSEGELKDRSMNNDRIIWLAAGNIIEASIARKR